MQKTQILAGEVYSRLTTIREAEDAERVGNRPTWLCQCECGSLCYVRSSYLKNGNTRSCGCLKEEVKRKIIKKGKDNPSYRHGYYGSLTHKRWLSIKRRCYSPGNAQRLYQQKGITMCERWKSSYECFLEDMGECPSNDHSVDRIDNSKGYEPNNCRWATWTEQARNRTNNLLIEDKPACQLADEHNIKRTTFYHRINSNKSITECLSPEKLPNRGYIKRRQLTEAQISEIKERYTKGEGPTAISRDYSVCETTIRKIVKGDLYKN